MDIKVIPEILRWPLAGASGGYTQEIAAAARKR